MTGERQAGSSRDRGDPAATRSEGDSRAPLPSISIPKGGGAIRGLGEKFEVNAATGTGSLSVPVPISPSRGNSTPALALSYDSAAGNGPFGLGWNLPIPAITRKTDKGLPHYRDDEDPDVFILGGAEDLVPVLGAPPPAPDGYRIQRYRPRVDGLFARIERWIRLSDGDVHWRTISADDVTSIYGKDLESRVADPSDASRVFSWLLCERYDALGNASSYRYVADNSVGVDAAAAHEQDRSAIGRTAKRYLERVLYGNRRSRLVESDIDRMDWMFEVVFDYGDYDEERPLPAKTNEWPVRRDPFSSHRAGFEVRTYRLCRRILVFHHFEHEPEVGRDCLVRSMTFSYREDAVGSLLTSISVANHKRRGDGYLARSLPPLDLRYSAIGDDETIHTLDEASLENLPHGIDSSVFRWVDLDGEGISGILTEQGEAWYYKPNLGDGVLGALQQVPTQPAARLSSNAQLLDLEGNGHLDVAVFSGPTPGYYERTVEGSWEPLRAFRYLPNVDFNDPNVRFVDLNGDGHADILLTEGDRLVWYPSLGAKGYGPARLAQLPRDPESGPVPLFSDPSLSILFADMSGDGLGDLVRIQNGDVSYWPSLGHGCFGAKVTMDDAPRFDRPDQFDPSRVRLADVDGSGTTDLLYLGRDGVDIYINASGNRFLSRRTLRDLPLRDGHDAVSVIDLRANGTACLVWSTPHAGHARATMRYVELTGGIKPYLLTSVANNLGAETHIDYAPSTKFYLADKARGTPWITRLPFPVHVVERVTVIDRWRNTRFSSRYSYHHGYFDGREREFRGFGRVERIDVEDFGTFEQGNPVSPYITDDRRLHQPPVKTISWFHTGAYIDRRRILSHYAEEYFAPRSASFEERALPEPDLDVEGLSAGEWREALRACKGMLLRSEAYELELDALQRGEEHRVRLFSVTQQNCHLRCIQHRGSNRHGVYLVASAEALTYHHDLNLTVDELEPDPRISHVLNLEIDEWGNVLESVVVAYPRGGRVQGEELPDVAMSTIEAVQRERHVALTIHEVTGAIDEGVHHRAPAPCATRTYEVTGVESDAGTYFSLEGLRRANLGTHVPEIDYHALAHRRSPQKRLVQHERTLYFSDDLRTPRTYGEQGALGLVFETYTLAATDTLLESVFVGGQITADVHADLHEASVSGYLSGAALLERFPDATGQYWARSGRVAYSDAGAANFFLPARFIDPFGAESRIEYDDHALLVRRSIDAVGNTATVEAFDYRVLGPRRVRDHNDNITEVTFDVLGLPVATALLGKGDEGDTLTGLDHSLLDLDTETVVRFFSEDYDEAVARHLLGTATTRSLYDFGERVVDGRVVWASEPACVVALVRERHVAAGGLEGPLQAAFQYSDGSGNALVAKVQAEPEDGSDEIRWIASGRTVLNNKGNPVKQYEPYFSVAGHRFEEPAEVGVTPVMYYDAAGRLIRTEGPDGSYARVEVSPWHVAQFDCNDTVLEPGNAWYSRMSAHGATREQQRAARLASAHANTPTTTFLDSLGREVVSVAHNRYEDFEGIVRDEKYVTYTKLDAEGKPLWVRDARGNRVMQYVHPPLPSDVEIDPESGYVPCYDIAGNLLFQHSMDAGDRWQIPAADGLPIHAWDVNDRVADDGISVREYRWSASTYDELRRPLSRRLRINDGPWQLLEKIEYGEGHVEAKARNLRGEVHRRFDPSGLLVHERFDFKGNLLHATRRLTDNYVAPVVDWSSTAVQLELEVFTQRSEYDALDRVTRLFAWHTSDERVTVHEPTYNRRGALDTHDVVIGARVEGAGYLGGRRVRAVSDVRYDAKEQRERVRFGNGTMTRYGYDSETFRLIHLHSSRGADVLQDLSYTYDPVGNVTETFDAAIQPVWFRDERVDGRSEYVYDASHRLIEATSREHARYESAPRPFARTADPTAFPVTDETLRAYTQRYAYDAVGNILEMRHEATGGWRRHYQYATDSNRLLRTWTGTATEPPPESVAYAYDLHGSILNANGESERQFFRWDYRDVIRSVDLVGGGHAFYNYDADKQRTRKRIERNGARVEDRFYLDGVELYRRFQSGALVEQIETHHVFLDDQRVLILDDVIETDNENLGTGTLLRYQYGDHLGSVTIELDEYAAPISHEEYHPYGTLAYAARNPSVRATAKRYRYTGMERDEETGLSYHTARYYVPWLARWTSADPDGVADGVNLFSYGHLSPTGSRDPKGTNAEFRDAVRFARALRAIDPEAFVGGVTVHQGRWIPTPASLDEHALLGRFARQARANLLARRSLPSNPDALYNAYRAELNSLIRANIESGGELTRLLEVVPRGANTALRFRSGAFRGQFLEYAHDISRAETARYGASGDLAIDLANLRPVGHQFHRAFLHVEQQLSRYGRLTSQGVQELIRRYAAEIGAQRSAASGTGGVVASGRATTSATRALVSDAAGAASVLGVFGGLLGLALLLLTVDQFEQAESDAERGELLVDIGLPLLVGLYSGAAGFGVGAVMAVLTRNSTESYTCEQFSGGCAAEGRYLAEFPDATEDDLNVLYGLLRFQEESRAGR
jgi:RHS repeat-associated protein